LLNERACPFFTTILVVDAVASVFPFGPDEFIRLRERFWIETIGSAALAGRSLIFTFAPEPTVDPGFPHRLSQSIHPAGAALSE